MVLVGVSIGVFVGIISGVILLMLVRTMRSASIEDAASVKTLVVQLFALVTLVGGASFLVNSGLFTEQNLQEVVQGYYLSLALTFLLLLVYPIFRLVYSLGREFGGVGN